MRYLLSPKSTYCSPASFEDLPRPRASSKTAGCYVEVLVLWYSPRLVLVSEATKAVAAAAAGIKQAKPSNHKQFPRPHVFGIQVLDYEGADRNCMHDSLLPSLSVAVSTHAKHNTVP